MGTPSASLSSYKSCLGQAVMAQACNPGTWEVEAGVYLVPGHPTLSSKFKTSLGSVRPRLKVKTEMFLPYAESDPL